MCLVYLLFYDFVLGLAGIGLIFTRSWLGWPKPANETGNWVLCDVILGN